MWFFSHDYVSMFHREFLIQKHYIGIKLTTNVSATDRACMLLTIAMKYATSDNNSRMMFCQNKSCIFLNSKNLPLISQTETV